MLNYNSSLTVIHLCHYHRKKQHELCKCVHTCIQFPHAYILLCILDRALTQETPIHRQKFADAAIICIWLFSVYEDSILLPSGIWRVSFFSTLFCGTLDSTTFYTWEMKMACTIATEVLGAEHATMVHLLSFSASEGNTTVTISVTCTWPVL